MPNSFSLKVVASDRVFYNGKSTIVVVPAIDGEQAIMAHHENMVCAIQEGELRFRLPEGDWEVAIVGVGTLVVAHNRVTILVDTAERPEEIDAKRAEEALERAQEQLRQQQSIQQYHVSQASLARALVRLKEKSKYNLN